MQCNQWSQVHSVAPPLLSPAPRNGICVNNCRVLEVEKISKLTRGSSSFVQGQLRRVGCWEEGGCAYERPRLFARGIYDSKEGGRLRGSCQATNRPTLISFDFRRISISSLFLFWKRIYTFLWKVTDFWHWSGISVKNSDAFRGSFDEKEDYDSISMQIRKMPRLKWSIVPKKRAKWY